MPTQLAQVVLFVHDVAAMQAFYGRLLGLPPIEAADGWVRLDAGGTVLLLHATSVEVAQPVRPRVDTPIKLCFHVDDVDLARARLIAAGVRMDQLRGYGAVVSCDGLDPEGNVFQLSTR